MLSAWWRKVQTLYKQERLLHPGKDARYPDGFFDKKWAGRGREYRLATEPVDIANWCGPLILSPDLPRCLMVRGRRVQAHACLVHFRYFRNKHVNIMEDDPSIVSGHYVDFKDGRALKRARQHC